MSSCRIVGCYFQLDELAAVFATKLDSHPMHAICIIIIAFNDLQVVLIVQFIYVGLLG